MSSDPFYQPNHKHFEVSPQPHHIFLHFTIHLVSSNWIASHPSYNCQTSVVCCLDLLAMLLVPSLLVSVISPFVCWWCRQQWHLSVRKETEQWHAYPSNLLLVTSGCVRRPSVMAVWFSHLSYWQQKLCTPTTLFFLASEPGWPEGKAERGRAWIFPGSISEMWKTCSEDRNWLSDILR